MALKKTRYIIRLQATCLHCGGNKYVEMDGKAQDCPECNKTGWQEVFVTLERFKEILEEGY